MEKLTVRKMVENAEAVARMTGGEMVLKSFYVFTEQEVYNELSPLEALHTYIDKRNSAGYIAIGINYTLTGGNMSLAIDIVNNKLGFTYICKDYAKLGYSEAVTDIMKQIAEAILSSYGKGLQVINQEEYRIHFYKVQEERAKGEEAEAEAKRLESLPYITVGKFKRCKLIKEVGAYELIKIEEALESKDRHLLSYGYIARVNGQVNPLGNNEERARKQFAEMTR